MQSTLSMTQTLKNHACAHGHILSEVITGFDIALIRTSTAKCLSFANNLESLATLLIAWSFKVKMSSRGCSTDRRGSGPCALPPWGGLLSRLRCLGNHTLTSSLGCPLTFPRTAVCILSWISPQLD